MGVGVGEGGEQITCSLEDESLEFNAKEDGEALGLKLREDVLVAGQEGQR